MSFDISRLPVSGTCFRSLITPTKPAIIRFKFVLQMGQLLLGIAGIERAASWRHATRLTPPIVV